ncbi:hypothetical protein [Oceanobacillus sp. CFH 90083]|uniref:hypothetical protein n=1 Tax=Oceanobacillus sp. CFH 90083 TaxID=2592336 RepID=UPI00128CC17C|nr:hypothetical protein [Oceanobacillus sp. CFH 90083]
MGFDLKPEIKQALNDIGFVKKYEEISSKYNSKKVKLEDRLIYLDIDTVIDMIEDLGYSVSIDKKEKFLKIEEEIEERLTFGVYIIIKGGTTELTWVVKRDGELRLGDPWSIYSRLLIDPKYIIRLPAFRDYDELEGILKVSFEMYEEFKAILIKEYLG